MDDSAHTLMVRLFRDIPDPRVPGKVFHPLHDILVIAVCSILAGLEHWTQMEDFGKANFDWFNSRTSKAVKMPAKFKKWKDSAKL